MSLPTTPAPDVVAAVVAYLQGVMGGSLDPAQASVRVWADYAPTGVDYPYAVVTEGPESYTQQSEDHTSTGYWLSNLATGTLTVAFYATSKAQARQLGREAVRRLGDPDLLSAQDGRIVTIFASQAQSAVLGTEATADPAAFVRIVTFTYVQQFLE